MNGKKTGLFCLFAVIFFGLWEIPVQAAGEAERISSFEAQEESDKSMAKEEIEREINRELEIFFEEQMQSYDMEEINRGFEQLFPDFSINSKEVWSFIIKGEFAAAVKLLWQEVKQGIAGEVVSVKTLLISVLVLGIASALFSNFSDLFSGKQVSQIGFYFLYLMLMAVLTKAFVMAAEVAVTTMENAVLFIKLFIPTWFIAVGASGGSATALFYYQIMLVIAYFVETFLVKTLVPFVFSYVVLALLNGIWAEERLVLLLELLKKGIVFTQKLAMGAVTGLSLVQSVILPVADGLKISALRKVVSTIPGIGGVAEGVTELVIGSAVLIKNSLGILLFLLLLAGCLLPVLKLFLIGGMIKVGAALAGIVSDKRIAGCADKVGEGCFLLLRCLFTSVTLFLIVVAVVAYSFR